MIEVVFYTVSDSITGVKVSGHAGFDNTGKDIVCSAVSALSINLANSIDTLTLDDMSVDIDEDGLLQVMVNRPSKETSLLFRSYEIGIVEIFKTYEQYVKIIYKEVRSC